MLDFSVKCCNALHMTLTWTNIQCDSRATSDSELSNNTCSQPYLLFVHTRPNIEIVEHRGVLRLLVRTRLLCLCLDESLTRDDKSSKRKTKPQTGACRDGE